MDADLDWIDHAALKKYLQKPVRLSGTARSIIALVVRSQEYRTTFCPDYYNGYSNGEPLKSLFVLKELAHFGLHVQRDGEKVTFLENGLIVSIFGLFSVRENVCRNLPLTYFLFEILAAFFMETGWWCCRKEPFYIYDRFDPMVCQAVLRRYGYVTSIRESHLEDTPDKKYYIVLEHIVDTNENVLRRFRSRDGVEMNRAEKALKIDFNYPRLYDMHEES